MTTEVETQFLKESLSFGKNSEARFVIARTTNVDSIKTFAIYLKIVSYTLYRTLIPNEITTKTKNIADDHIGSQIPHRPIIIPNMNLINAKIRK